VDVLQIWINDFILQSRSARAGEEKNVFLAFEISMVIKI
jgi:hypothetical protein